jgi:Matrixin
MPRRNPDFGGARTFPAFMEIMKLNPLQFFSSDKTLSSLGPVHYKMSAMKFALCFLAIALAGFTSTSHGYVLEGQSWPPGTVLVVQLNLGSAGRTLQDGNTSWDDAVVPVAGMWNEKLLRIQVVSPVGPGSPAGKGDHVNSVAFSNSVFGMSFGGSTLAVTYLSYLGSTFIESDTLFNTAAKFDSYRGPLQFPPHSTAIADIRRVFLHELGHTLGLGHPDTGGQHVTAVMNSVVSDQEVLSADDIAGGQYLYGVPALPTPTPPPLPTPTPGPGSASHLANISTRMNVGLGENLLIGGFIIRGSEPKKLILRAIGPSLAAMGVANAMADPNLELHDSTGAVIAANNDWLVSPQVVEIQQSGVAPSNKAESAIIATLAPGSYTAVVSGYGGGQGVALVEAYELDGNATRLVNISTRGRVEADDEAMIGGLIVQGSDAKRVIVRALGPSLGGGSSPITDVLADPVLELHDGSGNLIAANDDWANGPQANEIIQSTVAPTNNRESAVIATLGPGNYTAVVRGVNNTTGVGLVEVYDLDP